MLIRPLSDNLGVEVSGISLLDEYDDVLISELVALIYKHAVVCIRDQSLQPKELESFGSKLGTPVLHNEVSLRMQGSPAVMSLSNADDRDDRQLNGGAHWHTDLVYTDIPASFTMLHAVAVPEYGGRTLFANQLAAYNDLSDEEKDRIRRDEELFDSLLLCGPPRLCVLCVSFFMSTFRNLSRIRPEATECYSSSARCLRARSSQPRGSPGTSRRSSIAKNGPCRFRCATI